MKKYKTKKEVAIKVEMNLTMNEILMKELNIASLKKNMTKSAYVREAIEEKLKKDK